MGLGITRHGHQTPQILQGLRPLLHCTGGGEAVVPMRPGRGSSITIQTATVCPTRRRQPEPASETPRTPICREQLQISSPGFRGPYNSDWTLLEIAFCDKLFTTLRANRYTPRRRSILSQRPTSPGWLSRFNVLSRFSKFQCADLSDSSRAARICAPGAICAGFRNDPSQLTSRSAINAATKPGTCNLGLGRRRKGTSFRQTDQGTSISVPVHALQKVPAHSSLAD